MRVMGTEEISPYGEIGWMPEKDIDKLIYVYKIIYEDENFKPPSAWMVVNAFGDRIYFRSRDRSTAQRLCDDLHGCRKYTVVSHKI